MTIASKIESRVICVFYRDCCSKMLIEKFRCCPGHYHIWCSASNVLKHSINERLITEVSNVKLRVICVFYRHWCSKMLVEKFRCCPGHRHIWCSASNVLKHSINQGFSWTEIYFGHFVQAAPILFGHLEFF